MDKYGNEPRKGADILVQALEREGIDTVFAYPGGASMEIHQALTRSGSIRNILCRHEQVWSSFPTPYFASVYQSFLQNQMFYFSDTLIS